ncbi:para-aminobenzoate synthase, (PABA) [Dipsacomyces acuminosporus]|nr:para-aminobenzoate synthase, (PABA) [Dipsacomyces acuminosporus]
MPSIPDDRTQKGSSGQVRTLLVDNYDSYTFNLLQLLLSQSPTAAASSNVIVIRNDQYSWQTVRDVILPHVDNIIISPGPGSPSTKEDFGICSDLIKHSSKPLLGVCLGHQGIATVFGGSVCKSRTPVHGQTSRVKIVDDAGDKGGEPGLFDGVSDLFSVVRYHSLTVSEEPGQLPRDLQVLARAVGTVCAFAGSGIETVESVDIMALRHRHLPLFGVQFHPESICSEHGTRIIENFNKITQFYYKTKAYNAKGFDSSGTAGIPSDVRAMSLLSLDDRMRVHSSSLQQAEPRLSLLASSVDLSDANISDPSELGKLLFTHLYGSDPMPVWLDSAKAGDLNSSMSIMASACSPTSATVRYTVHNRRISVLRFSESAAKAGKATSQQLQDIRLPRQDSQGNSASFWTWMQSVVDETRVGSDAAGIRWIDGNNNAGGSTESLRFRCGWIGYFGYEMKAETVANDPLHQDPVFINESDGRMPDAQLSFIDRCVILDQKHSPPRAIVLALATDSKQSNLEWVGGLASCAQDAERWIRKQCESICSWVNKHKECKPLTSEQSARNRQVIEPRSTLSRTEYISAIEQAKEWIAQGESYEICLTTQFQLSLDACNSRIKSSADMLSLYHCMRQNNPSPYGALLWYSDIGAGVASCSPERFFRVEQVLGDSVRERWVEMKPIKGTCRREPKPAAPCHGSCPGPCDGCLGQWESEDRRRADELQANIKERAENLMIVDLIRHDLNSIASNGNVCVPHLMAIESYASVHQMVTTVRAQIRNAVGDVAALAHCFPPGSMTGAPKRRTLQLLHNLENTRSAGDADSTKPVPRGVYSGCLGYFSAHGEADWSVIIRTAVVDQHGSRVSVGAGGALTILSDPDEEWAEVQTKLNSILPGIRRFANTRPL